MPKDIAKPIQTEFERDRIRQLYARGPLALATSLIVSVITFSGIWASEPHAWVLVWGITVLLVFSARFILLGRFHTHIIHQPFNPRTWEWYYVSGAFLGGSMWGVLVWFMPSLTIGMQFFLMTVIIGISAGSLISGAPSALVATAFLIPSTWPLAAYFLFSMTVPNHLLLGAVLILFFVFSLRFGKHMRGDLFSSLRLAHEKSKLACHLEKQGQILQAQARQLETLSLTDSLTGLQNRRALETRLEQAIPQARRHDKLIALGVLDLDDFKIINDHYGHPVGDTALKTLAQRMQQTLRETDALARFGGDEFVVLMEDLDSPQNLEPMLERLGAAIAIPFTTAGVTLTLHASMGVAIFPNKQADSSADALLRKADQALYLAKLHKTDRQHWWTIADEQPIVPNEINPETSGASRRFFVPTYGPNIAALLAPLQENLASVAGVFIRDFTTRLMDEPENAALINALTPSEQAQLERKQAAHLCLVCQADLEETEHRETGYQLGKIHACCGLESNLMIQSYQTWMQSLKETFRHQSLSFQEIEPILDRRLAVEIEVELNGYTAIQQQRDLALAKIAESAWRARSFSELIEDVVQNLHELDEICSAAIARPDERGNLQFEAVSGKPFLNYLKEVKAGSATPIRVAPTTSPGHSPTSQAWTSGKIQNVRNYQTDERVLPWRAVAARLGIRAQAVLPIRVRNTNIALLLLYSAFPGGFISNNQHAFLQHLQQILALGYSRLHEQRQTPKVYNVLYRHRIRQLLTGNGLVMYAQPVLNLSDGTLAGIETLARLRDDGQYLAPAEFLTVFSRDELLLLFEKGLVQALTWSSRWHSAHPQLSISLNLPGHALDDHRYQQVVHQLLDGHPLPEGHTLTLEVLETDTFKNTHQLDAVLASWKALGVHLAQDDLGEAYSSLNRLRNVPFDTVKIDQNLVRGAARHPLRVLGFIAHLTNLAQEAEARVVVEGLETPGLIEAAAILGADFGQGFAIARPMPPERLLTWAEHQLPYHLDPKRPRTALGALASELKREQRLASFQVWPDMIRQIASLPSASLVWLQHEHLENQPLGQIQRTMQAALLQSGGIDDHPYREFRDRYLELLVARVTQEESTPATEPACGQN